MSIWFKGLRVKLLTLGLLPLVFFSVISFFSFKGMNELGAALEKAYLVRLNLTQYSQEMVSHNHALVRWLWTINSLNDPKEKKEFIDRTRQYVKEFEELQAKYEALPRSEKSREIYKVIQESWPDAKAGVEEAIFHFEKNTESTDKLGVLAITQKIRPHFRKMSDAFEKIGEARKVTVAEEIAETREDVKHAKTVIGLVFGLGSLMLVGFSFFIAIRLAKALGGISQVLNESAQQVSAAATQIASSSQELSQSAVEQAASLEETAASIEEMSSMVAKNSENATATSDTSGRSQEKAKQGREVVEKMIGSMSKINQSNVAIMEQVNSSNERIGEIVKVIEEIGSRTKVINDIVFQTKLLSFNASVEAARAGEHGKGFAVVAEEVGSLAQMSGNAAKEISSLLDSSIEKVNTIVSETRTRVETLIHEGKSIVETGTSVAHECGEVLEEIVKNVGNVSNMASEIASASQEQSRGVKEINKAMGQLDQATQQNASTSEECASAAEQLSAQADALKNAVSDLVVTVEGENKKLGDTMPNASKVMTRKAPAPNVVPLRKSKVAKVEEAAPIQFKKAVGDGTPAYDHEGFTDV